VASGLPSLRHDWVGGDIHGLSALAEQCSRIAPQIGEAGSVLNARAGELSCTAGWEGEGASAFSSGWAKVSAAGSQLAGMWDAIGQIVSTLAVELATLESALEQAADQLAAQGIMVDQGTGALEPTITAAGGAAAVRIGKLMGAYARLRAVVMARAAAYRAAAAAELAVLARGILPGAGGIRGVQRVITALNDARQVWAVPTKFLRAADERLPALQQAVVDAQAQAFRQLLDARKLYGADAKLPPEVSDQLRGAAQDLNHLQGQIDSASGMESIGSQIADGDPAAVSGAFDGAAPLVRAVPVVGTLAGAAATVVGDTLTGHSLGHGLADAAASTGAGYAAGAGTAAAIGTGTLATTAAGVVGGLAAGAAAGDFAHHVVQDIGSDVSKYGVLDGTLHSVGDAASQTWDDGEHLISSLFG
jgi:uncharacterized protein YukE